MWNLCCSDGVKKQHIQSDLAVVNLTLLSPWIFLWLTWSDSFTLKIVNYENISLLKVGKGNKNEMLNIY